MSTLAAVARSLRPQQWVKNAFVFATIVFAQQAHRPELLLRVTVAFAAFCALSSAVYLLNDLLDRDADRLHPEKRRRPIASGALAPAPAAAAALLLAGGALVASALLSPLSFWIAALYLAQNVAYSLALKRVAVLDVMVVAAGFLLRAWAGSAAIDVHMSRWLVLCTALLALFLGFVKRRQELASWDRVGEQRPVLRDYTLGYLDQVISIVTASTIVAYTLYVFSPEVADKLGTHWMALTLPFVLYGIFRYLHLVHRDGRGENPTRLILGDVPLLATLALWGATALAVLYFG